MSPLALVVLGTVASNPFAGMAWMHMQIAAGLRRMGHEAYYLEATSSWPYDPVRDTTVCDSKYAVPYLAGVAESFGLGDRWAYRRSYSDKEWLGPVRRSAEELLANADAVFNVAGSTSLGEDGLAAGRLVYFGTDPVHDEVAYAAGNEEARSFVDQHDDVVTYGENIGRDGCRVPPLPRLRARTRQPVLLDLWRNGGPARDAYTTVTNWRQDGREVELDGETYYWSKDREFARFLEVPRRAGRPIELATNLADPKTIRHGEGKAVRALGLELDERARLEQHGWRLVEARKLTTDPWRYRDYVRASRGELSIARDLHVRLKSGWFSERSACYLAAGRPVVAQDTGFGAVLPTGEGLFAVETPDEAVEALAAIESDYERHARAAAEIAEDYFRAESVLARLLQDLDL